jgi:GNAT superfamily N-acetyltransferase/predicted TIM-barrel fold metal-dependent hydrolase
LGNAGPKDDLEKLNGLVSQGAKEYGLPALLFATPSWTAPELEQKIQAGKFLGVKVYLSLAPAHIPTPEIRIFDFLPHHQLEVLNRLGKIIMLHIPRAARLKDPLNLAQLLEIGKNYPNIKLIVAHVGRAYCPEDVGDAFKVLAQTKNMLFDISANTNAQNFIRLIRAVGPKRILFGSDLPITRMRMRRSCEKGRYVNLVPKGLYGSVAGDRNMREVTGEKAAGLTFFLYEELAAFRQAARAAGLTPADIEDIFYNNAQRIIAAATPQPPYNPLQMIWPQDKLNQPPTWTMPEGYSLRTFRTGDEEAYISLMKLAGFNYWGPDHLKTVLRTALPEGLFFIVHDATQKIVATTVATHNPTPLHPSGGELGWVAGDPEHKGKGLGYITCAAVTRRYLDAGYRDIYLLTDDHRLPAIKTYLKLGWIPYLYLPEMPGRWEKICAQLKIDFAGLKTARP